MDQQRPEEDVLVLTADDFEHGPTAVFARPDGTTYAVGPRRYEVRTEGGEPTVVYAKELIEAWESTIADVLERTAHLNIDEEAVISSRPRVTVRRTQ